MGLDHILGTQPPLRHCNALQYCEIFMVMFEECVYKGISLKSLKKFEWLKLLQLKPFGWKQGRKCNSMNT